MRHPDERPLGPPDDGDAAGGHLDEGTIHAWLDGALPERESAAVERHADACVACASLVAEARGLVAASTRILAALDDVPAGVVPARAPEQVREELRAGDPLLLPGTVREMHAHREAQRERSRSSALQWNRRLGALAAVALLAVGTAVVVDRAGGPDVGTDLMAVRAERSEAGSASPAAPRALADRSVDGAGAAGATVAQQAAEEQAGIPAVPDIPASPTAPPAASGADRVGAAATAGVGAASKSAAGADAPSQLPAVIGELPALATAPPPQPAAVPTAPQPQAGRTAPLSEPASSDRRALTGARQESRPAENPSVAPAPPPPPAVPPGVVASASLALQPAVAGQVLAEGSGAPVAGALVSIEGTAASAVTDGQGRFTLPYAPAGAQTTMVRRAGFETVRLPLVIPDSGSAPVSLAIQLRPSDERVGDAVVTEIPVDPRREPPGALRVRQYAGCYRLEVGGRAGAARDAVERALPGWVTLGSQPADQAGWYVAEATLSGGGTGRNGWWRTPDRQRVELVWNTAQGELRLRLGGSSAASELSGRATWAPGAAVTAAGGAEVRARRVACG